jgi:hypothetical protein
MKYVPLIFAFLALLFVMALPQRAVQGANDKEIALPEKPDAPVAVTSTPTPLPTEVPVSTATPEPPRIHGRACLRINFEVSGDLAQAGTYEVAEVSGRSLASWEARAGWQDSGWIYDLEISYEAVHVNVFYHPADGSDSITMAIFNPAPGTEYGWVARDICHAVEVGWPGGSRQ